jgi:hypothetical protein
MCVTITVGDVDHHAPVWDRDQVSIGISRLLTFPQALRQIRAMLMWLGAPQCPGCATCWCGEAVAVPGEQGIWAEAAARSAEHSRGR